MTPFHRLFFVPFGSLALLAGCASHPAQMTGSPTPPTERFPDAASIGPGMSCAQLHEAAEQARDAKEKAAEHQRTSWQLVLPMAVAARYAGAAWTITGATASFDRASATAQAMKCPLRANG